MKPVINYINSLLFPLLPETSCFALKRGLLRLAGAKIGKNVRICSSVPYNGVRRIGNRRRCGSVMRFLISTTSRIEIGVVM